MSVAIQIEVDLEPDVWLDDCGYITPYVSSQHLDDSPEGDKVHIMRLIQSMLDDYKVPRTCKYDESLTSSKKDGALDWMLETAKFLTEKYEEI